MQIFLAYLLFSYFWKELNMYLMREYFTLWLKNVQVQISEREEAIQLMEQQRSIAMVNSSFQLWRRLFRATVVARYRHYCIVSLLQKNVRVPNSKEIFFLVNGRSRYKKPTIFHKKENRAKGKNLLQKQELRQLLNLSLFFCSLNFYIVIFLF